MNSSSDFLVIGAGIAGASAAYHLSRHGSVTLLERESIPGYHVTGRNAAIFIDHYGNNAVQKLNAAGRPFFESPPEDFTKALVGPRGLLLVGDETLAAALIDAETGEFQAQSLTEDDLRAMERLDTKEAQALCPVLRPEAAEVAFYDDAALDIYVAELLDGCIKGLQTRGGLFVPNSHVSALESSGTGWTATVDGTRYSAGVVVNAAGAWCDEIADMAGARRVGLVPKRRTSIKFSPPDDTPVTDWPFVVDLAETYYFRPLEGKLFASPSDETVSPPCDAQADDGDVDRLLQALEKATTLTVGEIELKQAGLRSFVADESPVLGPDPRIPNFIWYAAVGGFGMQTAPGAGRAVAHLAAEGRLPDDLVALGLTVEELSPARLFSDP